MEIHVDAARDKRNRTTVVVPEGARPGDTLVVDRQTTPLRCLECTTSDFGEGCVAIPAKDVMPLVRARQAEEERGPEREEQDMNKPASEPQSLGVPALVGSGIHLSP